MPTFSFEASGKLKLPTADELAKMDADTYILAYSSGNMSDGRPYYAYIAVKPSLYLDFCTKTRAKQTIILGHYGTVIASGFEAKAPPEVVKEMHETYGFDDQCEEKLVQEALRQQQAFATASEEKRLQDIVTMLKLKQKPAG